LSESPLHASEVCAVAGITYRQLDHMVRSGLVPLDNPTPGHGYPRWFDQAAVDRVVEIATMRRQVKALQEQVRASRQEQGLPETVSDSDTVARVASILRGAGT
jgi:hypothetical protein